MWKDQSIRFPHGELTRPVVVYQELLDAWPRSDVGHLYEGWLDAWAALTEAPGGDGLAVALTPYFESIVVRIQLTNRLREAYGSAPVGPGSASGERLDSPDNSDSGGD